MNREERRRRRKQSLRIATLQAEPEADHQESAVGRDEGKLESFMQNACWMLYGASIGLGPAGVAFGISAHLLAAHVSFVAAWLCFVLASAFAFSVYSTRKRTLEKIGVALVSGAILFPVDRKVVRSLRAHVHIIAVDELSAQAGDVIRARLELQNDGDLPILEQRNRMVMSIAHYSSDFALNRSIADSLFEAAGTVEATTPIMTTQIPAHSIELNSDQIGQTIVPPAVMQEVMRGDSAVYI